MGRALHKVRPSATRSTRTRLLGLPVALLLLVGATGCGNEDAAAGAEGGEGALVVYMVKDGAVTPVFQESTAQVKAMRPQGRAVLAVNTLFQEAPESDAPHTTYWGAACVTGATVASLTNNAGQVTLTLGGAGGRVCSQDGEAEELQRQQLAWTIIDNLEVDASTPIKVVGHNTAVIWDGLLADDEAVTD